MTDQEIMLVAKKYSMTSGTNLMTTIDTMHWLDNNNILGDIVECGVWRGGHIIAAMLAAVTDRSFWLFDTFDGMTEPGVQDSRKGIHASMTTRYKKTGAKGWCRAELDEVRDNVEQYRQSNQTVEYVSGPVELTLSTQRLPRHIALLRLDTDWYASTKAELEVLWPRVVINGVVIIDDYLSWQGCK